MKEVFIDLPFPPTVNSYYGHNTRGIKYVSKRGRVFRDLCAEMCNEQNVYNMRIDTRISLDVILYPPDKRKRDLDNYMKALQDALTLSNVWTDDELIDGLHIHRGKLLTGGKCSVRISDHSGFIMPDSPNIWDFIE